MTNKGVYEIKKMIGGISNAIVEETTEPYHKFELWMGEIEQYVKGVMYDKKNVKNDYSINVEKETIRTNDKWWEQNTDETTSTTETTSANESTSNQYEYTHNKELEKDTQKIKKKNKWLL
jgi:hypothetical protein